MLMKENKLLSIVLWNLQNSPASFQEELTENVLSLKPSKWPRWDLSTLHLLLQAETLEQTRAAPPGRWPTWIDQEADGTHLLGALSKTL